MSYVYKKNVEDDKNQKLIYFFFESKPMKSTNFLKTLDCVTPISFWNLSLTILISYLARNERD